MTRLGYLDILPTITSRNTIWIIERRKECFWGLKEASKAINMGLKDKKTILSRDVTFDEALMVKLINSQQVES